MEVTTTAVRIVSLACTMQGIYLITVPALNVLRKPLLAAALGVADGYAIAGILSAITFHRATRATGAS